MIKLNEKYAINNKSDAVECGWLLPGEEVEVVDIVPIKGKVHNELYLIQCEKGYRLGVYEEDLEVIV